MASIVRGAGLESCTLFARFVEPATQNFLDTSNRTTTSDLTQYKGNLVTVLEWSNQGCPMYGYKVCLELTLESGPARVGQERHHHEAE